MISSRPPVGGSPRDAVVAGQRIRLPIYCLSFDPRGNKGSCGLTGRPASRIRNWECGTGVTRGYQDDGCDEGAGAARSAAMACLVHSRLAR